MTGRERDALELVARAERKGALLRTGLVVVDVDGEVRRIGLIERLVLGIEGELRRLFEFVVICRNGAVCPGL